MYVKHMLQLTRLDRLRGAVLLFWPTWAALVVCSQGWPSLLNVCIFGAGVVLARSFGCVINDIADRDFDAKVARTKSRPLASGQLTLVEAYGIFFIFLGLGGICWLFLTWPAKLAALVALFFSLVYPFTKRFFFAHKWSWPWHFLLQFGSCIST